MKTTVFFVLLLAFVLDTLYAVRIGGLTGLTTTNIVIYTSGIILIASELITGRASNKSMPGVLFALIALVGVGLSVVYAQSYGVSQFTLTESARSAKQMVFEPVLLYIMAFMLVDNREQGVRYLLLLVIVIGALNIVSVVGAQLGIQIFQGKGYSEGRERLAGFVGNPNKTAYLSLVILPFQYYLLKVSKSFITKLVLLFVMLIGVYVILLSGSRGAMLLLVATIVGIAYKTKDMKIVYGLILITPIIALLVMSQALFFQESMDRVIKLSSGDLDTVSSGRTQIWGALLSEYTKDVLGMVFGLGFGSVQGIGIGARAHNMYLTVLIEFGIVGLLVFMYFIWSVINHIRKGAFDDAELKISIITAAFIVLGAWVFSTLIGVLQLITFVWSIALAALIMSKRDVSVGGNNSSAGTGVGYEK